MSTAGQLSFIEKLPHFSSNSYFLVRFLSTIDKLDYQTEKTSLRRTQAWRLCVNNTVNRSVLLYEFIKS